MIETGNPSQFSKIARLIQILEETTQPYRRGVELASIPIQDNSVLVLQDMPHESEIETGFKKYDCGTYGVGVNTILAHSRKEEFHDLVSSLLVSQGYIRNGATAQSLSIALQDKSMILAGTIGALGAHYGFWELLTADAAKESRVLESVAKALFRTHNPGTYLNLNDAAKALTIQLGFWFKNVNLPS